MLEQTFGGNWTEVKLEKIRKYLLPYTQILADKHFTIGYIDAFAGTGYRAIRKACPEEPGLFDEMEDHDAQAYRDGSARIALRTVPPFNKYIFIEKDPEKCRILQLLKSEFPHLANQIYIRNGDANEIIGKMCSEKMNWSRRRAVMFLDPFGMQVEWKTIELIAATKAIDLWYLFPIGSVNRLLERKMCVHPGFADCLDRTLGAQDWRKQFYKQSTEPTLFDEAQATIYKNASSDSIGFYIIKRLKTVFAGVVESPYILYNSKNSPLFMLCFAVGNPKAVEPAVKIARDILMKD